MFHLHLFQEETDAQSQYWGASGTTHDLYAEPWVSKSQDNQKIRFNKVAPLTFAFTTAGTVKWAAAGGASKTIKYTKNNTGTWTTISSGTFSVSAGDIVQFRGDNSQYASSDSVGVSFCGTTGTFSVYGNIMSLINSENYPDLVELPSAYTFSRLFTNCTGLTSASGLVLPAKEMKAYCYKHMFSGCTSLAAAPELPARKLADYCYQEMFCNCSSLTASPELPARIVETGAYGGMFMGSGIVIAPDLPATTVKFLGCAGMFQGCTSLTTPPPILRAMYPEESAYQQMFSGCTSLATSPEINVVEWNGGQNHCMLMFAGCSSLTTAPVLRPTTVLYFSYAYMFAGCTSLTTVPALPATTLGESCYKRMFARCTSLTTAPELPATTMISGCYEGMFSGCTSLTTAPVLPSLTIRDNCYDNLFRGCSNLTYVKCLATNGTAGAGIGYWMDGVSPTGLFIKTPGANWNHRGGTDGVPSGWTIIDDAADTGDTGETYVDLGLPSGAKWATCNLGAVRPSDYGDYFAWADICPAMSFTWNDYKYGGNGSSVPCSKYNSTDGITLVDGWEDPAFVALGNGWHMPNTFQVDELLANTTSAWTTQDGISGVTLTSQVNGKTIFFPAAGLWGASGKQGVGQGFGNWMNSLSAGTVFDGQVFDGNSQGTSRNDGLSRNSGVNIRPVCGGTYIYDSVRVFERFGGVSKIINGKRDNYSITYDAINHHFMTFDLIEERQDPVTGRIARFWSNGSPARQDVSVTPVDNEWWMFTNWSTGSTTEPYMQGKYCAYPYKLTYQSSGTTTSTSGGTTIDVEYFIFKGGYNTSTHAYDSGQTLYGVVKRSIAGTVVEDYPGIITDMYTSLALLQAGGTGYTGQESFKMANRETYYRNVSGGSEPWEEHDYVVVGNLAWATCNLGASSPGDNGDYYAWGEVATKSNYAESTWSGGPCNVGSNISGDGSRDAARANWGNGWRMPTSAEFAAMLTAKTSSALTSTNYTLNFSDGKQLVFPRAGIYDETSVGWPGTVAVYCADSAVVNQPKAFLCLVNPESPSEVWVNGVTNSNGPFGGCSIRPVHDLS